jgi:hypothetical protein
MTDDETLLTEGRRMFVLAAAVLERDVLLHGLTEDEQTVLVGAVLNAAKRTLIEDLRQQVERLRGALRSVAEGNLGEAPWQANYGRLRDFARAALTEKHNG